MRINDFKRSNEMKLYLLHLNILDNHVNFVYFMRHTSAHLVITVIEEDKHGRWASNPLVQLNVLIASMFNLINLLQSNYTRPSAYRCPYK